MSKDFATRDHLQQKPTVWVLVGLPRSGKSTWANLHYRDLQAMIVSTDDIRRALGIDRGDRAKETVVWSTFRIMCRALLARGQNLIVDNPNHTVVSRKQWVQMAQGGAPSNCGTSSSRSRPSRSGRGAARPRVSPGRSCSN